MKLQWNQINWKTAEEQVNRLQVRIVKATLEQKWRLVKRLSCGAICDYHIGTDEWSRTDT